MPASTSPPLVVVDNCSVAGLSVENKRAENKKVVCFADEIAKTENQIESIATYNYWTDSSLAFTDFSAASTPPARDVDCETRSCPGGGA